MEKDRKMKVLLIDPWGINNTSEYLNGLISGLSNYVCLDVFTNYYFEQYIDSDAMVSKVFFEKSENMKSGFFRKVLRGFEYWNGYQKILSHLKKSKKYDVIHINWLLMYKLDVRFLHKMRKYTNKIVYTAHNAIPHVKSQKEIGDLKKIYDSVDTIIVHGNNVKKELISTFMENEKKVYVQKHGCILRNAPKGDLKFLQEDLKTKILKYDKVLLCCGAVFQNKGIDRLCKLWIENYTNENALLVVGGRKMEEYPEYERLIPQLENIENVELFDGFISDEIMNTLFEYSTVIILPYKHASMSGIVFSAAQFLKPVACTDVGALPEYLEPNIDSFLCENTYEELKNTVGCVLKTEKSVLAEMGKSLNTNITKKCNWDIICAGLADIAYKK